MKINIVIDGNFLLYKDVFVLKKLRSIKDLSTLLVNDFNKLSKSFAFDNIYFVSDSVHGNWRKQIYQEYKGKREKDNSIDWEFVFSTYEDFKNKLKRQKNVKFLELPGLEGDDFIAHIVRETNKKGYSNIIIASDIDITQVLKYDLDKKWINIQWNYKFNDQRVYLPENYQLVIEKLANSVNENIFDLDNSTEFVRFIDDLTNRTKIKSVSYEEISVTKIIWGDKGDNIPSCVKVKEGKLNPEGRGIGKDGATTVYSLYKEIHPETIDLDSDEFISNLADVIIYYKKIKDTTAKEQIMEQLKFNRRLIFLDPKYMPKTTYDNMKNYYNSIENRIIEHEIIDLEAKLEEDDFFNETVEKDLIPEQFNIQSDGEEFDPDSFWEL